MVPKILETLFWAFQTALEQDCRKLLGKPLTLTRPEVGRTSAEGFNETFPESALFVEGEVAGPFSTRLFLAFDIRTAITISGLLLMTPEGSIAEKRERLDLSEADLDAIEEIGNVLYGALNRVLQQEVGKEWHLKKLKVQNGGLPAGEYITTTWPLHLASCEGRWHLLIPAPLGEVWAEELKHARGEEPVAPKPDGRRKRWIAILEGNEADGRFLAELLKTEGFPASYFPRPGELLPLMRGERPQAIILEVDSLPGWGVTVCRKLLLEGGSGGIPLIAASKAPTVEMVLALAGAGVKAFLVKPYTKEAVLERLTTLGLSRGEGDGEDPHR